MQNERPDTLRPLAVVNAANQRLCGGGGVDGMIHNKAGPELAKECLSKPELRPGIRCPTGEAVETRGYNFNTDWIIHTCGPVYAKDQEEECRRDLTNAYQNSLTKAQDLGVRCVAFAAISTGVYAYPFKDATQVSLSVLQYAKPPLEEVWVVLFTQGDFDIATGIADSLGLCECTGAPQVSDPSATLNGSGAGNAFKRLGQQKMQQVLAGTASGGIPAARGPPVHSDPSFSERTLEHLSPSPAK